MISLLHISFKCDNQVNSMKDDLSSTRKNYCSDINKPQGVCYIICQLIFYYCYIIPTYSSVTDILGNIFNDSIILFKIANYFHCLFNQSVLR